jgi:O-antigen ligase
MAPPQFYWMGLILALGLAERAGGRLRGLLWMAAGWSVLGLLAHQKRGMWFAAVLALGAWALWSRRWKLIAVLGAAAALALCLPFVQKRLSDLPDHLQTSHGSRMVLWREVAPRLIRAHPFGMGYNGTTYADFREVLPPSLHLEPGLRHLHNNFLQILVELGWHGLLWWSVWMGAVLWMALRRRDAEEAALQGAVGFAFFGLLLNGLVEYNFGTSEVLKLYLILFGLIEVWRRLRLADGPPGSSPETAGG